MLWAAALLLQAGIDGKTDYKAALDEAREMNGHIKAHR